MLGGGVRIHGVPMGNSKHLTNDLYSQRDTYCHDLVYAGMTCKSCARCMRMEHRRLIMHTLNAHGWLVSTYAF